MRRRTVILIALSIAAVFAGAFVAGPDMPGKAQEIPLPGQDVPTFREQGLPPWLDDRPFEDDRPWLDDFPSNLEPINAGDQPGVFTGDNPTDIPAIYWDILPGASPSVQATMAAWAAAEAARNPTVTPTALPGSSASEPCDDDSLSPRTLDEMSELRAEIEAATPEPAESGQASEVRIPIGQPVDATIAAAVNETLVQEASCFNEEKDFVAFALSSDDRFRHEPEWLDTGDLEHIVVLAVTNVAKLQDGRIGAVCMYEFQPGGKTTKYCIFIQSDSRWLIDESWSLGGLGGG